MLPIIVWLSGCSVATTPSEGSSVAVFTGAGDIGWRGSLGPEATARLLDGIPGTVFTAGDNAYPLGRAADFNDCYEPSWGRHRWRTRPTPGNHDYESPGAEPYYSYFGANAGPSGRGYYSFDLGAWHIVAMNSNVSMQAGSPQEQWARADVEAAHARCTLAYWHHPLFSSGPHGNDQRSLDMWQTLYALRVDVIISGHDHLYERFAPQTPFGVADPRGIRQFTVGTGGAISYDVAVIRANSEARKTGSFGVLKLTLRPATYDWEFLTTDGGIADAGSTACTE